MLAVVGGTAAQEQFRKRRAAAPRVTALVRSSSARAVRISGLPSSNPWMTFSLELRNGGIDRGGQWTVRDVTNAGHGGEPRARRSKLVA